MDIQTLLLILLVISVCGVLLLGFPVAFSIAGVSIVFVLLGNLAGEVDLSILGAIPSRIFGSAIVNIVLLAVPMFVFMGVVLERSKVAEELLSAIGLLLGSVRGGLGYGVTFVGMLLAASTGIVGATVVTMGLLALPTMLKSKYDPAFVTGAICAAGTLGQIIPPSIVLILLADQISNAYVLAQRSIGNFSPEPVSVGDLFVGAIIPGLILVGLYLVYQAAVAIFQPHRTPALPKSERKSIRELGPRLLRALFPPILLIIMVLGSILVGFATPTEAAAVGAIGAILLACINLARYRTLATPAKSRLVQLLDHITGMAKFQVRHVYLAGASLFALLILSTQVDLRLGRELTSSIEYFAIAMSFVLVGIIVVGLSSALWMIWRMDILKGCCYQAASVTTMVFTILIGAAFFSTAFRGFGGDEIVKQFLLNLPGGFALQLFLVMLLIFLLGFIIDFIEISLIVVPIIAPVLLLSGISPVWLGILIAVNLQTSFLTPPFGFSLFYLRGVAPKSIATKTIYRGVVPFIIIQCITLLIIVAFPDLVDFLPKVVFGSDYTVD